VKKIIHFFVIVTLFSSLTLMYAQETLEATLEVAAVSYDVAVPEVDTMKDDGLLLNPENSNPLHSSACTGFEYIMFGILGLLIIMIISFRIRRNTLKLF